MFENKKKIENMEVKEILHKYSSKNHLDREFTVF